MPLRSQSLSGPSTRCSCVRCATSPLFCGRRAARSRVCHYLSLPGTAGQAPGARPAGRANNHPRPPRPGTLRPSRLPARVSSGRGPASGRNPSGVQHEEGPRQVPDRRHDNAAARSLWSAAAIASRRAAVSLSSSVRVTIGEGDEEPIGEEAARLRSAPHTHHRRDRGPDPQDRPPPQIALYVFWHNLHRPSQALGGRTPWEARIE